MPPNAVYVGRPTIWGNPWSIVTLRKSELFNPQYLENVCVEEFKGWLNHGTKDYLGADGKPFQIYIDYHSTREQLLATLHLLRGKDLACWCSLDKPCHADVLLELANK